MADLPDAAKGNLDLVAGLHERAEADVSPAQSAIERVSAFCGSPAYFVGVLVFVGAWVAVNLWGDHAGWAIVDKPPFHWLQGMVSLNALLLTISVLIRQMRMAELAEHRAHLDLQINLLTEQKVSKLLQFADALQRQRPDVAGRPNLTEDDLTTPADPEALLDEIRKSRDPGRRG